MKQTNTTKERILNSTFDLIWSRSFSDVGVNEICRKAGVVKGSFYHFFPSKKDLSLEVLDLAWESTKREIFIPSFENDLRPLQKIRKFFNTVYEYHLELYNRTGTLLGCAFGNLALEMSTQDEDIRKRIGEVFDEYIHYFETTIKQALLEGDLHDVDPEAAAQSTLAYLEGALMLAKTRNDPDIIRQLGETVLKLYT